MLRSVINSAVQKKSFLMFFTSVIYILGLCAYFSDNAILFASIITILSVLAIAKNYLSPKLVLFWCFMFFLAFFNANFRIKDSDTLYQIAPQNASISGQIVSIPAGGAKDKTKFFFNVSKIKYLDKSENIKAKTLVSLYSSNGKFPEINIGDSLTIEGKLRTPFEATNPSQFDYGKYLRNFNTFTLFYAEANDCKVIQAPTNLKWKFLQGLNNVRNDIIQTHSRYLKSPNLELLGGIVFGDDAISPPEGLKNSFKNSGLLHLLAASGMNVALIYGIWFFCLRKLKVPFNITVSSGIFVIIFYALMTGLGPSVIRAALMLIFILVGKLIDRDTHSVSLLSFVALLMLIYNPAYINDVGFELSFIVTFGLLVMTPALFEKISPAEHPNKIPNWLSGAILIPIIAQIWVAPIQMYYFNSFSLYSVFANIVILPFVTIVSFGGFLSAVLALIKPLACQVCMIFDFVLNPVLTALVAISNFFSHLPHSLLQVPQPSFLQIFLYYTVVLLLTLILKTGFTKKIAIAFSVVVFAFLISLINLPNRNFETIAFDVQNADAFLIKTPQNKYFIIDTGKMAYRSSKGQAQAIILEYLKDKGIKNIEALIITHFDSDHAGGAEDLIKNLNIKTIYVNSLTDQSKLAQKVYQTGANKITLAQNNKIIYSENNLKFKTYLTNLKGEDFENENSIITLVSDGKFDELFMGDAGVTAFEKIEKYMPDNVEIFKVGHHGAKNVVNKSLLDRINPQISLISTGINNYGHPNGITLDLLKSHKTKILRTDRQNSIKISKNAEKASIYSFSKGKYIQISEDNR